MLVVFLPIVNLVTLSDLSLGLVPFLTSARHPTGACMETRRQDGETWGVKKPYQHSIK